MSKSNYSDKEQLYSLIVEAVDNLEQMVRARELTDIIWDININQNRTEQDWRKTEILLECYERMRDESLEAALLNLRELIQIMPDSI